MNKPIKITKQPYSKHCGVFLYVDMTLDRGQHINNRAIAIANKETPERSWGKKSGLLVEQGIKAIRIATTLEN